MFGGFPQWSSHVNDLLINLHSLAAPGKAIAPKVQVSDSPQNAFCMNVSHPETAQRLALSRLSVPNYWSMSVSLLGSGAIVTFDFHVETRNATCAADSLESRFSPLTLKNSLRAERKM